MPVMIIRHKVKDFGSWKKAFDAHKTKRAGAGLSNERVLRSVDDASELILIFDAADVEKAKAFGSSGELQTAMQSAGVTDKPDVYFLNAAG